MGLRQLFRLDYRKWITGVYMVNGREVALGT